MIAADGELLDVRTGETIHKLAVPVDLYATSFSATGRFFYASEEPSYGGGNSIAPALCNERGLANRTYVYDLETGTEAVELDCNQGMFLVGQATFAGYQFLRKPSCCGCAGGSGLSILDPDTLDVRSLAPAIRRSVLLGPSPDRPVFVASGDRFRRFAAAGTLLQEIAIAGPGQIVYRATWVDEGVWSPESSVLILVGPRVV